MTLRKRNTKKINKLPLLKNIKSYYKTVKKSTLKINQKHKKKVN